MFNFAFANYESKVYLDGTSKLDNVKVSGGKQDSVEIAAEGKLLAFGKKGSVEYKVEIQLPNCVKAPVKQGDTVGKAVLKDSQENVVSEVNLLAKTSVNAKSYWDFVKDLVAD